MKSANILAGAAAVLRRPMDEAKLIRHFPGVLRGSLHFDATNRKWACTIRCRCQCACEETREVFVSDLFHVHFCKKCTPLPGMH